MNPVLSQDQVAPIVEMSEAEVWLDLFTAAPADLAKRYGIQSTQVGPTTVAVVQQRDVMLLNRVIGLGVLEPATEMQVDSIIAAYRAPKLKNYAIQLSPYASPDKLPSWLTSRGLSVADNWAIVFRDSQPPPDVKTDLTVQKVGVEYSGAFAEIACDVFDIGEDFQPWLIATVDRPRWHHYLAFDGSKPVATAALFVDGNIGWLGFASTRASHRRRGAQSALMAQRIRDGIAMGCDWFVSECEEDTANRASPSFHNLLRNGFKLAYLRPNYADTTSGLDNR